MKKTFCELIAMQRGEAASHNQTLNNRADNMLYLKNLTYRPCSMGRGLTGTNCIRKDRQ